MSKVQNTAPLPEKRGDILGTEEEQAEYWKWHAEFRKAYNTCGTCGSTKLVLSNYDMMWGDGDLHCENGHYVRMFDRD